MSRLLKVTLLALCLWPTLSCAAENNYADNPAALAMVDELVASEGFSREELIAIFSDASRQESIIDAMNRPAEKTKPWYEYREIFLNDKRTEQGVEFYNQHRETLQRAEEEMGVPAEIIVAIIIQKG